MTSTSALPPAVTPPEGPNADPDEAVSDRAIRPTMRALTRAPHDLDQLFAWEQDGTWHPLHSHDVSRYIADRAGATSGSPPPWPGRPISIPA